MKPDGHVQVTVGLGSPLEATTIPRPKSAVMGTYLNQFQEDLYLYIILYYYYYMIILL